MERGSYLIMKIKYEQGDLFDPKYDDYIRAFPVAWDLNMMFGYARKFNKELKVKHWINRNIRSYEEETGEKYIPPMPGVILLSRCIAIISKMRFYQRAADEDFKLAVKFMNEIAVDVGIKKIAVPMPYHTPLVDPFGYPPDADFVLKIFTDVFLLSPVELLVVR